MTIYIIKAEPETWYSDMVGKIIENTYIGETGHYHCFDNIFGVPNPEIPIRMLLVYHEDAIVIDGN